MARTVLEDIKTMSPDILQYLRYSHGENSTTYSHNENSRCTYSSLFQDWLTCSHNFTFIISLYPVFLPLRTLPGQYPLCMKDATSASFSPAFPATSAVSFRFFSAEQSFGNAMAFTICARESLPLALAFSTRLYTLSCASL